MQEKFQLLQRTLCLLSLVCHVASAVCLGNVCSSDFLELQCLDTCAARSALMNTKCAAIYFFHFFGGEGGGGQILIFFFPL